MIALNFTVGRTTLPFLVLLLATAAWISDVHGNDHRGHETHGHDNHDHDNHGHDNGIKNHGNGHTRNYDEDTKSSDEVNKKNILKTEEKKEKIDASTTKKPPPIDFGRLDLRVGHVRNATKHPNADSLYVESIDLGEDDGPRTVVSGLANHVPLEKMLGRTVIVLCNLKPRKIRGVLSEGMIMCASSKDGKKVEILNPPPGSLPGDIVILPGKPERYPDKVLDSQIFEEIAKDLKTDADLQATYKGIHWYVQDWRYEEFTIGTIGAQTLINCTIY